MLPLWHACRILLMFQPFYVIDIRCYTFTNKVWTPYKMLPLWHACCILLMFQPFYVIDIRCYTFTNKVWTPYKMLPLWHACRILLMFQPFYVIDTCYYTFTNKAWKGVYNCHYASHLVHWSANGLSAYCGANYFLSEPHFLTDGNKNLTFVIYRKLKNVPDSIFMSRDLYRLMPMNIWSKQQLGYFYILWQNSSLILILLILLKIVLCMMICMCSLTLQKTRVPSTIQIVGQC